MDDNVKRIISITCDESEKMIIATKIHEQLVGNQDYIDSNILLNCDRLEAVDLFIFEECTEIPTITI